MCGIARRLLSLLGLGTRHPPSPASPFDYKEYWDKRYRSGGNSGAGSYGELARFKADYINAFLAAHPVRAVLEFGCGDGNQLQLVRYPRYLGLDVSAVAVRRCRKVFGKDETKSFALYQPGALAGVPPADLVVCLDVLYHITDDEEFLATLKDIFASAGRYVMLYTSLEEFPEDRSPHVKHRNIRNALLGFPEFTVREVTRCPYTTLSSASFVILERDTAAPYNQAVVRRAGETLAAAFGGGGSRADGS